MLRISGRIFITTKETKNTKTKKDRLTASQRRLRKPACFWGRCRSENELSFFVKKIKGVAFVHSDFICFRTRCEKLIASPRLCVSIFLRVTNVKNLRTARKLLAFVIKNYLPVNFFASLEIWFTHACRASSKPAEVILVERT